MEQNEILQGNILIASFMGKVVGTGISLETINKYHTSWDWQIPAYSKIIQLLRPMVHDELERPDIEKYFEIKRKYLSEIDENNPSKGQQIIIDAINFYNETIKTKP